MQNLRYAMLRLEGDLRTLGTNVPARQPSVVYAGEDIVAFHADYATNVAGDPFAVYYTPGAPNGQVYSPDAPVVLPVANVRVSDDRYEGSPGLPSPAELVVFFLTADSTSANPEDHVLFRQVNGGEPQVLARNLRRIPGEPFFRYLRVAGPSEAALVLDSIPDVDLPVFHDVHLHGSSADTGASALADSIRGVRVTLRSVGPVVGGVSPEVDASRVIRFANSGLTSIDTCGGRPLLGVNLVASVQIIAGVPQVDLVWTAAIDETGGERDVVRYVLWRRVGGAGDWGDPFRSIPAGQPAYSTIDRNVTPGEIYQYALSAQDCSPSLSDRATSLAVAIP